jgi:hypothetical protein
MPVRRDLDATQAPLIAWARIGDYFYYKTTSYWLNAVRDAAASLAR